MTNKRPSRRRIKKWERRSRYIVRRAYDRGPNWFLDQVDLTARQQAIAKRYGHDASLRSTRTGRRANESRRPAIPTREAAMNSYQRRKLKGAGVEPETVPCKICGNPTPMTGTKLCNRYVIRKLLEAYENDAK